MKNFVTNYLRLSFLILVLLGCGFSGCSGSGIESGPVALPVPFSGTLTLGTKAVISEGAPLAGGSLFGHPSGNQWPLCNSQSVCDESERNLDLPCGCARNQIGTVTFDLGSTTLPIVAGSSSEEFPRSLSNATATLQIEGSEVTCELQYIDFLFPQEADFSVADTVPIAASPIEISDATTILRKGYAGGTITKANGLFFGAEGKTCDHRYVYGEVEHRDGVRTFFKQEVGVWLIQGFQGPANP